VPASELQLNLILKEVSNQKRINEFYSILPISKPDKSDFEVKKLLNGLVDSDTQDESWKGLTSLNSSAVPALIRLMDDKRKLAPGHYFYASHDNHFNYAPVIVQDAVSIILNKLTQTSFEFTANGGTSEVRKRDLAAWRAWLYYNQRPSQTFSNNSEVQLFKSPENSSIVGILYVTQWKTGVLKSDFEALPLTKMTLENSELLWGKATSSKQEMQYVLKTFKLWGQSTTGTRKALQEYQLDAKYIGDKLCAYTVNGGLIARSMQMIVEEDKLNRRHGPSDCSH
jgi:hypothetical protein